MVVLHSHSRIEFTRSRQGLTIRWRDKLEELLEELPTAQTDAATHLEVEVAGGSHSPIHRILRHSPLCNELICGSLTGWASSPANWQQFMRAGLPAFTEAAQASSTSEARTSLCSAATRTCQLWQISRQPRQEGRGQVGQADVNCTASKELQSWVLTSSPICTAWTATVLG